MKVCSKCGLKYEDKFAFCKKCGGKLETKEEKQFCPNCGKHIETKGDFCPFCGSSIAKEKKYNTYETDTQQHESVQNNMSGNTAATKVNLETFASPMVNSNNHNNTKDVNGKNNKRIIIASVIAFIVVVGFFMFGGRNLFEKKLPQPESDGTIALAPAMDKEKWGMLDKNGNWFIEPRYLSIGRFSEGLVGVLDSESKKFGFIDKNGKWIIKPQYYIPPQKLEEESEPSVWNEYQAENRGAPVFKEGFACVQFGENNYGYIDKNGKVLCSNFENAFSFKEGFAKVVTKKGKGVKDTVSAVIDKKGEFVIKPTNGYIFNFNEGYFRVRTPNGMGFWKPYDSYICSPEYLQAEDFSEGLAFVWTNKKIPCIIDKNFNVVVDLVEVEGFVDAIVNSKVKVVLGNNMKYKNGRLAIDLCENIVGLPGKTIRTITIDRKGNVVSNVVEDEYANIGKDELVPKDESFRKYGYVNNKGEYVIKPQFSFAHEFKDGVAVVENWDKKNGQKFGLIDMKGNFVKELSGDILIGTDCGLIISGKEGKIGALDSTGTNIVIPYKFEAIHSFTKYKKEDLILDNVQ